MTRYAEAKTVLEKALKMDPRNIEAMYYLGHIAEDQGDYKAAEGRFEQVLRSAPDNLGSLFELGNIYTHEENYERARDYYERAVKASPSFPPTYYRLSVLYRRLKNFDRANAMFALFQKYQQSDRDKQSYHPHGVLTFLAQTQDLSESERMQRYKQELLHVADTKPDDLNVLLMFAQIEFRLGNRDAAIARIDQITRIAPDDSKVQIRAASLLKTFRLHARAADQLSDFLRKHDTAEDVRCALAALYENMGRTADAIQVLTQSTGQRSTPATYHYLLGRLLIQQGKLSDALRELQAASTLEPDRLGYAAYVAVCTAKVGKSAEAARLIAAMKSKWPNNVNVVYAEGIWLLFCGNRKQAQFNFQHAVDLSYNWEAPWLALAYALCDSPVQAETILNQTESMFPYSPWPCLLKAKLLNSDQELERALKLAPADPRIYLQVLPFCLQRGDCDRARQVSQHMSELGIPENSVELPTCAQGANRPGSLLERGSDISFLIEMLSDSEQEL